ncbi:hypothetical protein [Hwangdonia sp.]|uniref:hypothetical protein n=1 Tax=Hwangdonia sp. TaxID=1883432 RepID=UPI003AB2410B
MKNYKLLITCLGLVSLVIVACSDTVEKNNDEKNQREFYINHLEKELASNGVKNTSYFTVDYDNINFEGKTHSEVMANIDKVVHIFKENFETDNLYRLNRVNLLINIINQNKLIDKEIFYKKLVNAPTDDEKIEIYYNEQTKYFKELGRAKENGDYKLSNKIANKYAYLTILARDSHGNLILYKDDIPKTKENLSYSIKKYDVSIDKNTKSPESKNSTSVMYVNGIKVI